MRYRKEIDGLRALAVIPVILFHAGIQGFSGGYVGVDVFFVISGYLITTIILEEKKQNTFSIINFYERRARRILPALTVVLMVTTIAAYLLLPARLLQDYSQSLFSVATFTSNIYFFLRSGYFEVTADQRPLLHTWSLAVEEQYYVFFPLAIMLLWRFGKKGIFSFIAVISIASLLLAHYLSVHNINEANFYLIFSRAWELLFGAMAVFVPVNLLLWIPKWLREIIGLSGLALIIYAIVCYDQNTPFPGFYALIPVVGACFIIVFADFNTLVGAVLSNRLFVFIGLISYSIYLWHQPIFAFLRIKSIGEPSKDTFVAAIICTVILAIFSWKCIETPFRNKVRFTRDTIFKFAGVSISLLMTLGLLGNFNKGFESRFEKSAYNDSIQFSPKRKDCHTSGVNYLKPEHGCTYFGDQITWASFGDSHTVEIAYGLAEKLKNRNEGLIQLSFSTCAPALIHEVALPGCSKWIKDALIYLETNNHIKNVLLGFRYSAFLYGDQLKSYPNFPDENPTKHYLNISPSLTANEVRELYWQDFVAIIKRLQHAHKDIYILYPIPELPISIQRAITPLSVFDGGMPIDLNKATSVDYYKKRNEFILDKLDSLEYGEKLHAIKPLKIFCDEVYCQAVKNGKALYFDDNHPSISGAELLIESIPDFK